MFGGICFLLNGNVWIDMIVGRAHADETNSNKKDLVGQPHVNRLQREPFSTRCREPQDSHKNNQRISDHVYEIGNAKKYRSIDKAMIARILGNWINNPWNDAPNQKAPLRHCISNSMKSSH